MKELLSPAGDMECLKAAVMAGADAVYASGHRFGARKFAKNFTNDELVNAIKYCHLYGVKLYVTMNTLVKTEEVEEFLNQVEFLYKHGVDAILMQDFGLICLCRKIFPNLNIHASTQANNTLEETVKLYYSLGVKRVVFSRELSIDEIDSISVPIAKEAFIHGALCISYSGLRLMSSMQGSRSANRGECTGPCRLKYNLLDNNKYISTNKYLLSTKELNSSNHIKRLINSTIYSLKIEGRMKSPLYVGFVTNMYRRLLDGENIEIDDYSNKLKTIFNRGFTDGYIFNSNNIMNNKYPNHIGLEIGNAYPKGNKIKLVLNKGVRLRQNDAIRLLNSGKGMIINYLYDSNMHLASSTTGTCYIDNKLRLASQDILSLTKSIDLEENFLKTQQRKIKISFKIVGKIHEPLTISITDGINTIEESSSIIEEAKTTPTTTKDVLSHINKLGNTPFTIDKIDISLDKNIFIPVSIINSLRRNLVSKLIEKRESINIDPVINKPIFVKGISSKSNYITCKVLTEEQLRECILLNVDRIYVEDLDLYNKYKENEKVIYYQNINKLINTTKSIVSSYFNYNDPSPYGDYHLNVANIYTAYYLDKLGLKNIPLSVELSTSDIIKFIKDFKDKFGYTLDFEVLVYGRVENMILKGNPLSLKENKYTYTLEAGNKHFPVYYKSSLTHILNYTNNNLQNIKGITKRLDFYQEDAYNVQQSVKKYIKG